MGLEELTAAVEEAYSKLDEEIVVELDRETRTELAMLFATLDTDDPNDLLQRGIHLLFQMAVETGKVDFQLRNHYDVTYDEYLSGMTFEEMTGGQIPFPQPSENDRRYQF